MNSVSSEVRDGMQIDWDVAIPMADGVVLRADIFRPLGDKKVPVIVSYGPYAKGLDFRAGYKSQWARVVEAVPEILEGSSNKYQNWELVDPERWVPEGYACMRIDSRGAGRSPGLLDCWSPLETQDFHECIEWAGTQPWSNGKVGINGISYYAMNQWTVAATQPPHLAAICIWEGSSDYYRELCRHGGILCDFLNSWYNRQVLTVQNGVGDNGARSAVTGVTIAGPDTLSEEQLKKNRLAIDLEAENRHLVDEYYKSRTPDFSKITVPLLSAGNWGGMGLHTRGNFEGYLRAASKDKWLEVHGDTHFTHFYSTYGVELQKKFFAHFLKGEQSGWDQQPKVSLNIRHPHETFKLRAANEWPLTNTQWTKFYLQPEEAIIDTKEPGVIADSQISYEIAGDGLTFLTPVRDYDFEITGPVAAKLFLSSETTDADVTLALRLYDPSGKEISFIGSNDPRVPVGLGWLRASHRKLDPQETKPYRPWHSHDELQPLTPGVPVELDIEILPTSIVVPKGYRLGLNVRGSDYEFDGTDAGVAHAPYPMKGVGPFTHTNTSDRPANVFSGKNTLHFSSKMKPYLLLPIIPKE